MENENDFYEERLKICRECGLGKETARGLVCDPSKYIDVNDKTTIYRTAGINRRRGCGCAIQISKAKNPNAKCIVGKW